MLKHIVIWRLKDFAEGKDKKANAFEAKKRLEALKGIIKEIRHLEVGIGNGAPDAFDLVLTAGFASAAGLNTYLNHPAHLKIGEFISKIRLERKFVDYEV